MLNKTLGSHRLSLMQDHVRGRGLVHVGYGGPAADGGGDGGDGGERVLHRRLRQAEGAGERGSRVVYFDG